MSKNWLPGSDSNARARIQSPRSCPLDDPASPFHGGNTGSNPAGDANETEGPQGVFKELNQRGVRRTKVEQFGVERQPLREQGRLNLSLALCACRVPRRPEVNDLATGLAHEVFHRGTLTIQGRYLSPYPYPFSSTSIDAFIVAKSSEEIIHHSRFDCPLVQTFLVFQSPHEGL
jgi:hypothetical protein